MTRKDNFRLTPLRAAQRPCRLLRSQGAFRLGTAEYDETTRFWCVRSLDACGPDGAAAHAAWCQAGRICYEEPSLVV
jgi:hypothetical protein